MTTEKNKAPTKTADKKLKESFKLIIWLSFGFVLFCVLGYLGFLVYVSWPINEWSVSKAASLGDSFGILSSLFSGLAFAGLIVTIVMQNKTLKAQMDELQLARQEYTRQGAALEGQEDAMKAQLKRIQVQQYELTLYKLIEFKNNASLEILTDGETSVIDEVKRKYADYIALNTYYFKSLKESSVEIYFRRVVGIFKHLSSIKELDAEIAVLRDMAIDSFSREELRAFIVFLSENKNSNYRECFKIVLKSDVDFLSIFKLNLTNGPYLCSDSDFDFDGWHEHDKVIRMIEFLFIEISNDENKYYELRCFYNDYLNDLNSKIEELNMFGSIGNFEGDRQNYLSDDDIKYRIECVKEKILPLTRPQS